MQLNWKRLAVLGAALLGVAVIGPVLSISRADGPESFEACMLREMRGQVAQLLPLARSVCRDAVPLPKLD